jgi:flagellar motor switch protein FliN/FliY
MAETAVADEKMQAQADDPETLGTQAQSVAFSEVSETAGGGKGTSIDILLDMEVPITVALGKTEIPIQRLLQLSPGAVLKLDKPIDMPAELYLKDTKFATGSIVVVDDQFAVRITEILTGPSSDKPGKP